MPRYTEYLDDESEWASIPSNWNGNVDNLHGNGYNNSLRLKGLVTSYDLAIAAGDPDALTYTGWLTLPPSTWITTQIGLYVVVVVVFVFVFVVYHCCFALFPRGKHESLREH